VLWAQLRQVTSGTWSPWHWPWNLQNLQTKNDGSSAQLLGRLDGPNQPLGLGHQLREDVLVESNAFAVDVIVVLVLHQVEGAGHAGQAHVDLHLRVVLRLGPLHALLDHLRVTLCVAGLELEHVPGLGCLWHTKACAIHAAAEVPAKGRHAPLGAVGRSVLDLDPDPAQIGHQARLFEVASLEQAQHAALEGLALGPAEGQPHGAGALVADQRRAHVRAVALAVGLLVASEDGLRRGGRDIGECRHGGLRLQR